MVCVQWSDQAETSRGHPYHNRGLSLFEFNDEGKITHYYEYLDPDNFLEAIGAK
jgi:ketosteroid isomerase-like protein